MKTVETILYRFDELEPEHAEYAIAEWNKSFLANISIYELWFTKFGLLYAVFNT